MQRGSKTISNSLRPQIDTLKNKMRFAINPFDGSGTTFKTAVKELRTEGVNIIHDKEKCRYYNAQTISDGWGYKNN